LSRRNMLRSARGWRGRWLRRSLDGREAHEAWSQSEEYGKAVAPVVEGSTGMDVGHVEFVKVE
jgi:hypothetical protein